MFSYSVFEHHYDKPYCTRYIEPVSKDYRVFVNGQEVPVYTCRISAYPLNRVWPGFQRPVNQSEIASFVNLVSDEPLNIEVITSLAHEKIYIKPYSKNIEHEEKDGKISFTLNQNGDFVLGADSYHHCLYIFNSRPIAAPDPKSVTHYFGPGIHMPGKIVLKSDQSVYVDKDALVFGCIFAENAKNLHIFGNGLFDDTSEGRLDNSCYEPYTNGNIKFYDCENVKIEGVLFRNSAIWCVNIFHCFDVDVEGIKVFGQWHYNTDGVDIVNSQRIRIKNSFLHSFDDNVTIKAIDMYALTDCRDILIEGCTMWCDWGKTCEVGIETACREYRDITFRNCDLLRAGDVAIDIQNGDSAEVHDITFEDIRVEYDSFDTPQVYQRSDEQVYDKKDEIAIPYLIKMCNPRFRSFGAIWGAAENWNPDIDTNGIQVGGIHHVTCKNIKVYYDEKIPLKDGKFNAPIDITSVIEGVRYHDITISGVSINGVDIDRNNAVLNDEGVENLVFESGAQFEQLKKNTVDAQNQLRDSEHVRFENPQGKGKRILFLGNSITLHGVKEDIGWNNCWGMAASSKDKDYVHLVMAKVHELDKDAAMCICQGADWERGYKNGHDTYYKYQAAHDFCADIIVMRLIDNCTIDGFDDALFRKQLGELLDFLNPTGKAKIIITTGFWKHPGDASLRRFAIDNHLPVVELGDLGEDDKMKAIGLFWHRGVANHPGDAGMQRIAERVFEVMKGLI